MPVMITGGLRTRTAMNEILASGEADMIGLGRPVCVDTDLPAQLLAGRVETTQSYELGIHPPKAGLGWFCLQLMKIGRGELPDRSLSGAQAILDYVANEQQAAQALIGRPAAH
jgi:hypothetical protein